MKCRQRLYLNGGTLAAGDLKLVSEGDPAAVTLYASPGDEIPEEDAARFGLEDGALPGFKGADGDGDESDADDSAGDAERPPADPLQEKEAATPPNKERKPGKTKGA